MSRWYEECGESFFTELILSFSDQPMNVIKSLALTCHFIYDIYKNCNDLWRRLLIDKYAYQQFNLELLDKAKGKLMEIFFNMEAKEIFNIEKPIYRVAGTMAISKKFCHTLTGKHSNEFNLDLEDYNYNIEDHQFVLSCSPMYEEEENNYEGWDENSSGLIFIFVIDESFSIKQLSNRMVAFRLFHKMVKKNSKLKYRYKFSFGMHFTGIDVKSDLKRKIVSELRNFINKEFNLVDSVLMECDIGEVKSSTCFVMECIKQTNLNQFIHNYLKSTQKATKCFLM